MHLPHHFEDCHGVTLPNYAAQAAHMESKRKAFANRLLPSGILTAPRPLTPKLAELLNTFLRALREYAHTLVENKLGYEYGDPEYDNALAELNTLEAVRERLIRAELIAADYLLEPSPHDFTHGDEIHPAAA